MSVSFIKVTSNKLFRSTDNLEKRSKQSNSIAKSVGRTLQQQSVFKKQSIVKRQSIYQKRKDGIRRKQQRDLFEASKSTGSIRSVGRAVTNSTKGFLGRILDAIAITMVGWAVINLPTIISLSKQLGERIVKISGTMSNFMSNTLTIFREIGTLSSEFIRNLIAFDFSDMGRQVDSSLSKVRTTFNRMEIDFFNAINILVQPFDFGEEEDQQKPSDQQPSTYEPPPVKETTGGGKILNSQAAYSYLRQLGVPHIHALGILANIKGESGFRIDSKQPNGPGVGLFQYSSAGRKNAFLQNVPDWKTNWKGQIKYAIGEDAGPAYFKTQFTSPEEAAEWWMNKWERPDPRVRGDRRKEHNDFIKSFKPAGIEKPTQTTPLAAPPTNLPPNAPQFDPNKKYRPGDTLTQSIGRGVGYVQIGDIMGASRGGGRKHAGIDIQCPFGTYIALRLDSEVMFAGWQDPNNHQSGYGQVIDLWVPQLGVQLRFGHCAGFLVTQGKVPAGKSFARVGSTGNSTGPHIHFEYTRTKNRGNYGSDGDPSPYIPYILLTGGPNSVKPGKSTPAQITGTRRGTTVSDGITPENGGKTLVVAAPPQLYQNPATMVGSSGGSPIIVTGPGLNSLIKQRVLLELAYT